MVDSTNMRPWESLAAWEQDWVEERQAIREVDGGLRPSAAYLEAREDLEQYKRDLPEFERLCGWK